MKDKLPRLGVGGLLIVSLLLAGCGADPPTAAPAPTAGPTVAMNKTATPGVPNPTPSSPAQPGTAPTLAATRPTAAALTSPAGGGSTSAGVDMAQVEACKLLSQAEIEAVLGPVTYDPHAYQSTGSTQKQCIYVATVVEDNDQVTGQALNLVIWPLSDWEMLKTGHTAAVSGIGDEAYTSELGPTGLALWALFRDRAVVQVEVFPKNIEYAKQLARTAADHLP